MKGKKRLVWLFIFTCSILQLSAQSYLHFIENKGQWNNKVAFKGELPSGAFFLKPDGGYKMVLHNRSELNTIIQRDHNSSSTNNIPSASISNNNSQKVLHSHAYEVKFLNANPHPEIIKEKQLANYNNYFIGNDPSKWNGACKIYQSITYKNIYPNIDIRYYTSSKGQLKYDIIVYPGGDVNNVSLYYDGVDDMKLKDGVLKIKTSVDDVLEGNPISYLSSEEGRKEVACNYNIKGNIVRFNLQESKPLNATLVIDPTIIFAGFSGSTADNWAYTATYDDAGNFYAGGIVFATGYQVSNGAYQQNFKGGNNATGEGDALSNLDANGFDIGIMKFNSTGTTVMYATYIGGSNGNEQPHSLIVDGSGNLVIAGRTTSSDYPTMFPNKIGPGGGQDIILTKLNATGTALIGSLRIGGTGNDGVNINTKDDQSNTAPKGSVSVRRNYGDDARSEVVLDNAGNIYLASCTQSNDFPTTNPFQTINKGGSFNQDGVIIKAAADLTSIIFSSYIGGTGDDAAFALAISPVSSNIYIAGATASKDLANNINAFQGGVCDGFIAIINNTNNPSLISTNYVGTASADQLYGIQFNKAGDVFITGTTEGLMPVVASPFNATGQASGKQFITKLSADLLTVKYSANFGNGSIYPNISPAAFLVDNCENVYVSGWGGGLDVPYTNSGTLNLIAKSAPDGSQPLKTTTDGNSFYFFVLERNANSQLYGGFYGDNKMNQNQPNILGDLNGVHVDGGTSRFDNKGVVYQSICACGPDPGMSTSGVAYPNNAAYQSNNGYSCNLFALKIAFNLAGVSSAVQAAIKGIVRDTAGCVPLQVSFKDTIGTAKQYIWRFGDGSADTTTTVSNVSHFYNSSGNFLVRLIGVDTSKCFPYDTSFVTIKVGVDSVSLGLNYSRVGGCNSLTYQFNNISVRSPTAIPFKANSFTINFGDGSTALLGGGSIQHTYAAVGTYNISLVLTDSSYCNQYDTTSIQLRISNAVKAQFTTPAFGCAPYNAVFTNTSLGGTDFKWVFGDGSSYSTNSAASVTHLYSNIQTYSAYLIAIDTNTCNKVDTSAIFIITAQGKPTASFTASPQPPISNTAIVFTNNSVGAISYHWIFGDGTDSVTTSSSPMSHLYNSTGTFNVSLIAINNGGCTDTISLSVSAIIIPVFGIPTAVAPNCNCINNKIFIKGFGIAAVKWNIYNRWGTLVFTTTNKDEGWDGKYKGILLPQDVYQYILEITMTDGSSYTKNGDITLLK